MCENGVLRHTHATILIESGVPVTTTAKRLGHSTPATTVNTPYGHTHSAQPYSTTEKLIIVFHNAYQLLLLSCFFESNDV